MPAWLAFVLFIAIMGCAIRMATPALREAASERKKHSRGYRAIDNALLIFAALIVIAAMLIFIVWADNRSMDKSAKRFIGQIVILGVGITVMSFGDKLLKKFSRKRHK
jgi:hypothetical protein